MMITSTPHAKLLRAQIGTVYLANPSKRPFRQGILRVISMIGRVHQTPAFTTDLRKYVAAGKGIEQQ
jgi:hypothetical protein